MVRRDLKKISKSLFRVSWTEGYLGKRPLRVVVWWKDTVHWLKTGESTLHCVNEGEHHRVYLHSSGYSRLDITGILKTKKWRAVLKSPGTG